MKKDSFQYLLSIILISCLAIYLPVLSIIRKNDILEEYYNLNPEQYFIIAFSLLILPIVFWGIGAIFFKEKEETFFKSIFCFFLIPLMLGILNSMPLLIGCLSSFGIAFFVFIGFKNLKNFVWVLSVLGFIVLGDSLYKTWFVFNRVFPVGLNEYGVYSEQFENLKLSKKAPDNIVMILLDGTDITTSHTNKDGELSQNLMPNMKKYIDSHFRYFPKARTNAPQTYVSIPTIMTGLRAYPQASKEFRKGRSLFHILEKYYRPTLFTYKNYYHAFCKYSPKTCYPFKQVDGVSPVYTVLLKVYLQALSFGKYEVKELNRSFTPDFEPYTIDQFLTMLEKSKKGRNLFYYHIFRRSDEKMNSFDSDLKKIMNKISRLDNTLFIILSDHGIDYSQPDEYKYGMNSPQNEKIIRVPIFLSFPGRIKPGVDLKSIENIDLFKTIIDFSFENPEIINVDGQNITNEHYKEKFDKYYNCNRSGRLIGLKDITNFQLEECK